MYDVEQVPQGMVRGEELLSEWLLAPYKREQRRSRSAHSFLSRVRHVVDWSLTPTENPT